MSAERAPRCACGDCKNCKVSAGLKRVYTNGDRPRYSGKYCEWTREQEDALRKMLGAYSPAEIAERLTARFGPPRTKAAVLTRARLLGLSTTQDALSQFRVYRIFGVRQHMLYAWVRAGLLVPAKQDKHRWWYRPADVERFIREHGWAYDAQSMEPGPYRSLALIQERWLTIQEAALALRISPNMVSQWMLKGVIPFQRIVRTRVRIRARDIPAIRDAIHEAQRTANSRRATNSVKTKREDVRREIGTGGLGMRNRGNEED